MAAFITVLIPFLYFLVSGFTTILSHKYLAFGLSLGRTRTGAATQKEESILLYTDWVALALERSEAQLYLPRVLRLFSACFRGFPWSG